MTLENVAITNDFATVSKVSTEQAGYLGEKHYSSDLYMVAGKARRRAPLINIGYAIRVRMIRDALANILKDAPSATVISLGAGFDNTFHWVADAFPNKAIKFIEVDCLQVIEKKASLLFRAYGYSVAVDSVGMRHVRAQFGSYSLLPLDLTKDLSPLESELSDSQLTVWISECVLCYMDLSTANRIIQLASQHANSHFLLYEQLVGQPHDAFTQCMKRHFESTDSPIQSCLETNGPREQRQRFLQHGFASCHVERMCDYFYGHPKVVHQFINQELFDEWEELDLFLSHYGLTHAHNNATAEALSRFSNFVPYVLRLKPSCSQLQAGRFLKNSSQTLWGKSVVTIGGRKSLRQIADCLRVDNRVALQHPQLCRHRHQVALWKDQLIIVGGVGTDGLSSLVVVDISSGSIIRDSFDPLLRRIGHSVTVFGSTLYVIGGLDPSDGHSMPTVQVMLEDWTPPIVVYLHFFQADGRLPLPATRYCHAVPINHSSVAVIGGLADFALNDIIVIDMSRMTWVPVKIDGRQDHMMVRGEARFDSGHLTLQGERIVCFSMGSHLDAACEIDLRPLIVPDLIPRVEKLDLNWTVPQIVKIDLGEAMWDGDFVMQHLSPHTRISVHKATCADLQFYPERNFVFETLTVKEFFARLAHDHQHWYYFRALSTENARKRRADFWHDYAALGQFLSPDTFPVDADKIHSSVLRVSSGQGFGLWCHYDVMSNFLVQLHGHKRVRFYPPGDAPFLYLQSSSSTVVPGSGRFPLLQNAHPVVVDLNPGEMLFIPALWFHHVTVPHAYCNHSRCNDAHRHEEDDAYSVAVNVFWRDLDESVYSRRDLYGNADIGIEHLPSLPEPFQSFYAWRQSCDNV